MNDNISVSDVIKSGEFNLDYWSWFKNSFKLDIQVFECIIAIWISLLILSLVMGMIKWKETSKFLSRMGGYAWICIWFYLLKNWVGPTFWIVIIVLNELSIWIKKERAIKIVKEVMGCIYLFIWASVLYGIGKDAYTFENENANQYSILYVHNFVQFIQPYLGIVHIIGEFAVAVLFVAFVSLLFDKEKLYNFFSILFGTSVTLSVFVIIILSAVMSVNLYTDTKNNWEQKIVTPYIHSLDEQKNTIENLKITAIAESTENKSSTAKIYSTFELKDENGKTIKMSGNYSIKTSDAEQAYVTYKNVPKDLEGIYPTGIQDITVFLPKNYSIQ